MKKVIIEIIAGVIFVLAGTYLVYINIEDITLFWQSQLVWSIILAIGWAVVSLGYFHQGWLVYKEKRADHVSLVLPATVFVVQCVLFVKGIYYGDWSLISGALMVNSGVTFSLYQIIKYKKWSQITREPLGGTREE